VRATVGTKSKGDPGSVAYWVQVRFISQALGIQSSAQLQAPALHDTPPAHEPGPEHVMSR
jgi:hypothetical protein